MGRAWIIPRILSPLRGLPDDLRRLLVEAMGGKWRSFGFVVGARHFDRHGNLIWEDSGHNIFHDEGEQAILSAFLVTNYAGYGAPTANVYVGLDNRVSLAEGDVLPVTGEPSGNGYARQALSTAGTGVAGQDWVLSQPAAAWRAKSKQITFSASGGPWTAVVNAFVATTVDDTGKLLSSKGLSQSRTLQDGEDLTVDYTLTVSE